MKVHDVPAYLMNDESLRNIDAGEKAAIALASALHAELLLMDDRQGVHVAENKGFLVTGTLGVLEQAAKQGLVSLPDAFNRLRRTTFHCPERLMQEMLEKNRSRTF